jgi:geranylgeranyl pyrophosphate synthase
MLSYQLASRGKRIRALLPVWGAANLGGCPEDALDVGVGLELLHNATLVHDDLQDGDRYRRGVPTVWHRWGAVQAINAGDALVFESFARIGRAPAGARVMRTVSNLMLRVIEGQAMEFQLKLPEGDPAAIQPTIDAWKEVAVRKTGAFFVACLQSAAIAAGAGEQAIDYGAAYGHLLGLLFQAQDDYLDLVGEKGRRTRGSDLREGKLSFPVVWAYENVAGPETAALRGIVALPRERKTPEVIASATELLERTGALGATAAFLGDLFDQVLAHPLSGIFPELAVRLLAPVAHALPARER